MRIKLIPTTPKIKRLFSYLEILLKKYMDILKILPQIYYKNAINIIWNYEKNYKSGVLYQIVL